MKVFIEISPTALRLLDRRHGLGINKFDVSITVEVGDIEADEMLQTVSLHCSHQTRVMRRLAFHVVLCDEVSPFGKYTSLIAE